MLFRAAGFNSVSQIHVLLESESVTLSASVIRGEEGCSSCLKSNESILIRNRKGHTGRRWLQEAGGRDGVRLPQATGRQGGWSLRAEWGCCGLLEEPPGGASPAPPGFQTPGLQDRERRCFCHFKAPSWWHLLLQCRKLTQARGNCVAETLTFLATGCHCAHHSSALLMSVTLLIAFLSTYSPSEDSEPITWLPSSENYEATSLYSCLY